ncbi:MAG: (d)CMP kinase [Alphaproteobacteria bacterium]|nr:(d)CMP kinase [Alphaproteobacteria bacterium]
MIIAIDGPAASGKGTLAKRIADYYGFHHLDTGLLYRAVARDVRAANGVLDNADDAARAAERLDPATLADPTLRHPGLGNAASVVAQIPRVRDILLAVQHAFAGRQPGAVLDGRDIGTIVCPQADVKIFVIADTAVRAERRFRELKGRGEAVTRQQIFDTISQRDKRDTERADSPMRPAPDALLLDTTELDIEEAFDAAIELIKRKIGQPGA